MDIQMRPLGLVMELVAKLGLEVTYAYDDLVFVAHNAFLFRFTGSGPFVDLVFNVDCPEDEQEKLATEIISLAGGLDLIVTRRGQYELAQNEDGENMSLTFS